MAVIYSRLGGCLEVITKLGPLLSTDLWAWVKGLIDKLINHLGLGSFSELSLGDPQGWLVLFACLPACRAWGRIVANTLGISPACLGRGRGTGCLGISALCLGTTCLRASAIATCLWTTYKWGTSTTSWWDGADCLRGGAGFPGTSVL